MNEGPSPKRSPTSGDGVGGAGRGPQWWEPGFGDLSNEPQSGRVRRRTDPLRREAQGGRRRRGLRREPPRRRGRSEARAAPDPEGRGEPGAAPRVTTGAGARARGAGGARRARDAGRGSRENCSK